jgi:hypothetical protein
VLVPVALPAGLDLEVVVGHILLYPVVDLLRRLCVRVFLGRKARCIRHALAQQESARRA